MELLSNGSNVLLILAGFGILIFIHELGHFMAARWAGIRCESFAVGMGPVVAAWRSGIGWRTGSTDPATIARFGKPAIEMSDAELMQNGLGETEWSLRALPLGGYVRMLGQDDLDPTKVSPNHRSYQRVAVWKRMVVVTAGVISNLVLAVLLFVLAFMVGVRFEAPVVGNVVPGSPAESAKEIMAVTSVASSESKGSTGSGLQPGDEIIEIDGSPVQTFSDIQIAGAMAKPDQPLQITVRREDSTGKAQLRTFTLLPKKDRVSGMLAIGIDPGMSAEIGTVSAREQPVFDSVMASAGLAPFKDEEKSGRIVRLLEVGTVAKESSSGGVAPLQYRAATSSAEASLGTGLSAPALLDLAARKSDGKPFASTWMTASGTATERMLVPVAQLQIITAPEHDGIAAETDRGLFGLVPLLRIQRVPDDSANRSVLQAGDVILRVENVDGPRMAQLRAALLPRAGQSADAVLMRGGELLKITLKVDGSGRLGVMMGSALELPMTAATLDQALDATGTLRPTPVLPLQLLPRTTIQSVNGVAVTDWNSLRAAFLAATAEAASRNEAESVSLVVAAPTPEHEQSEVAIALSPEDIRSLHALSWASPVPSAVFDPLMTTLTAHGNPLRAVAMGFRQTKTMVVMTYLTLDRIFRGSVGVEQLRGPVGIVHLGARVVDRGAMYLVFFLAMISVNLAVLNFLPLPIVDGGLFLYLLYERVTGKAPSLKFQNAAAMLGLVLLGSLFLFTFYNDVMRLFTGG